jgi:hypothetical protein
MGPAEPSGSCCSRSPGAKRPSAAGSPTNTNRSQHTAGRRWNVCSRISAVSDATTGADIRTDPLRGEWFGRR